MHFTYATHHYFHLLEDTFNLPIQQQHSSSTSSSSPSASTSTSTAMKLLHLLPLFILSLFLCTCYCLKCNSLSDLSINAPTCWPLNNSISCNFCTRECFPFPNDAPRDIKFRFCKEDEICCQHECGTSCSKVAPAVASREY